MHRRQACEPWRNLDHAFVDQHRHGVQVTRQRRQAQALRFQRDRPTARERVEDRRWSVGEAAVDLRARLSQHLRIVGVLPHHQPFQNPEQALPLILLLLWRQRPVTRRIFNQRSPDHRPSGRQWPARPPEM